MNDEPRQHQQPAEERVDLDEAVPALKERAIVTGTVVRVDTEGVLVDVGAKSEGVIPARELSQSVPPEQQVAVGDRINVMVMRVDGEEGNIVLSKKRADAIQTWDRLEDAYRAGRVIHAMVVDKVKGGLVVDLGVRGFVPGSHVDLSQAKGRRFEALVGQSIALRIIELDRHKQRAILSHKQAIAEERGQRKAELLASLEEGQVREGVVRRLTDFGAFVDIGGVDALLPISEMSWTYIKHPSEVVRRGQHLQLGVLRVDRDTEKISLTLKQILPDPWAEVEQHYRVGDVVKGKITRIVQSGAFMRLRDLDAFIPISELAERRVGKVEDVVQAGETIEAQIVEIRPEERRMIASLRRLARDRERSQVREFIKQQDEGGRATLGDIAGDVLRQARAAVESRGEEPRAVERDELPAMGPAPEADEPA